MSRDPHRLFSEEDRRIVRDNQDGRCAGPCGGLCPTTSRCITVSPGPRTGRRSSATPRGLCRPCHLDRPQRALRRHRTPANGKPRLSTKMLPRLRQGWTATVAAAPGAGKTLFTGFTIHALVESGTIERVVIFVPNNVLKGQWARDLKQLGIHVDPDAGRHVIENPRQRVLRCRPHLPDPLPGSPGRQRVDPAGRTASTLYVFDEVHHLAEAEHSAWGQAVGALIGSDPDHPRHPVLNLSGTLFRSTARPEDRHRPLRARCPTNRTGCRPSPITPSAPTS